MQFSNLLSVSIMNAYMITRSLVLSMQAICETFLTAWGPDSKLRYMTTDIFSTVDV